MRRTEATRRAVLAAVVGGAAVGGTRPPVSGYLDRLAPLSGSAWRAADRSLPDEVESPYGSADLRYDDARVPHVDADGDLAGYHAVGYAQAADRLFQMDLFRRRMRGELSAAVGERTVESDEFHARMDFAGAAEATWAHLEGTDTGDAVAAYADGVNAARDDLALPLEFELLGYEPAPWRPADTMLLEKQISWGLTGSFRTLRQAVLRDEFGDLHAELYPDRLDHDAPIIRRGETGGDATASRGRAGGEPDRDAGVDTALVDWLSAFEPPDGLGSNSWVVSGEHTASGDPLVANDPHLQLMAPPIWYQQALSTPETAVRGVTFPGVPFVVIGANDAGAWGFTNVGADVIDFYSYETREENGSEQYRYRGEWRDYDAETRTVEVADGDDREVTVRKTVHGPVVEREGQAVAVAWTGLTATETTVAIHEYAHSDGMDDVLAATRRFDLPTQNLVYADRDGDTLYYVTGRIPDRRIDGENVPGDRVFDGSAGEAEWEGFTPYGTSSWDGFVPFEEKPHVVNPGYLGTANQRVVDDPSYYLAESYAPPFRGSRLYDRLDAAVEDGDVDPEFMRDLQQDVYDERAERLVPVVLDAEPETGDGDAALLDALRDWDYRMTRDSRAALAFDRFLAHYRRRLFADPFEARGLDDSYWPSDWVVCTLDADSPWFDELGRSRAEVVADALADAREEIADEGWESYGDANRLAVQHPFELDFLAYPERAMDGSPATLKNVRTDADVGSSWRMVAAPASGDAWGVLPGGNSGDYFSDAYHDQLDAWATGGYRRLGDPPDGDPDVTFEEGDG